jgi:enamine deaminase RidA (YjgF/YER057c/UK114 family)
MAGGTPGAGGDRVTRRRVSSGGPWEATAGYSRALAVGDACFVSGTTDAGPEGASRHPGDPAGQARAVFAIIEAALTEAGFALDDVVRTRMFIVDPADAAAVIAVHGELFRDIRPASTLVVVARLIDPTLLVEIEAEARKG